MVLAYADREEHAMGLALSLPSLDHSALVEEVRETTALVILALRSMMYISEEEVRCKSLCFAFLCWCWDRHGGVECCFSGYVVITLVVLDGVSSS